MGARQFVVQGRQLQVITRQVGGLGWTWAYRPERGPEVVNTGSLQRTEEEAYAAAERAASAVGEASPQPA